jgi:hypothetical protein
VLGGSAARALDGFLRFYGELIPSNCHKSFPVLFLR